MRPGSCLGLSSSSLGLIDQKSMGSLLSGDLLTWLEAAQSIGITYAWAGPASGKKTSPVKDEVNTSRTRVNSYAFS